METGAIKGDYTITQEGMSTLVIDFANLSLGKLTNLRRLDGSNQEFCGDWVGAMIATIKALFTHLETIPLVRRVAQGKDFKILVVGWANANMDHLRGAIVSFFQCNANLMIA